MAGVGALLSRVFKRADRNAHPVSFAARERSTHSEVAVNDDVRTARVARRLAETLELAIANRQFGLAERIAESGVRLGTDHPRWTESLARFRLRQGNLDAALLLIESSSVRPASLRLLHALCLIAGGRKAEAHLELAAWNTRSTIPLNARLLLALLEWDCGNADEAIALLMRNLRDVDDPTTLQLALTMATRTANNDFVRECFDRLTLLASYPALRPPIELFLVSLGLNDPDVPAHITLAEIETLARELAAAEAIIPTLVKAQLCAPDRPSAMLLASALEQAIHTVHDRPQAIASLMRLQVLLGRRKAARAWLHYGQAEHPMSAPIAQVAGEVKEAFGTDSDDVDNDQGDDARERAA